MKGNSFSIFPVLILLCVLLHGCGYRHPLSFPVEQSSVPISLYVPLWQNNTSELGFESQIHSSLKSWLLQSGRIRLVDSPGKSDMHLTGTILSMEFPGQSYNQFDQASSLKAVVRFSFTLKTAATAEDLLSRDEIRKEQDYLVGSDALFTRSYRLEALRIIADDLSEDIYQDVSFAINRYNQNNTRSNPTENQ